MSRDQVILEYIKTYIAAHNYAPSIREIGEATGIRSTSLVRFYLQRLERAGKISRDYAVSRSIVVVES